MKRALLILPSILLAASVTAGTITTDGEDLILSTKDGGLKIHNRDKSNAFQLGGRIQWDYDNTKTDNDDSDDLDIRRARLYAAGTLGDWSFKSQFNIDGGGAEDLYIRYTGFGKLYNITVGNQKEPFGLEQQISSKDISSLERSAQTELYTPGRNAGIQLHGKKENYTYGIGIFEAENGDDDADSLAITARATHVVMNDENGLVHLGLGYTNRAGDTSAEEVDIIGLEAAFVTGPLHLQAEYFDGEFGNIDADGFYFQAGYVITGETRPYKGGKFKRIKPANANGAWEVVGRIDSGDGNYGDIGVGAGDGSQITLGLNWYANNNVRVGLSYTDGENDDTGIDGEEIRLRAQLAF